MPERAPVARMAYRVSEAAEAIGVSDTTLDRWIAVGVLPCIRVGGRKFITKPALEKLMEIAPPVGDDDGVDPRLVDAVFERAYPLVLAAVLAEFRRRDAKGK